MNVLTGDNTGLLKCKHCLILVLLDWRGMGLTLSCRHMTAVHLEAKRIHTFSHQDAARRVVQLAWAGPEDDPEDKV